MELDGDDGSIGTLLNEVLVFFMAAYIPHDNQIPW